MLGGCMLNGCPASGAAAGAGEPGLGSRFKFRFEGLGFREVKGLRL